MLLLRQQHASHYLAAAARSVRGALNRLPESRERASERARAREARVCAPPLDSRVERLVRTSERANERTGSLFAIFRAAAAQVVASPQHSKGTRGGGGDGSSTEEPESQMISTTTKTTSLLLDYIGSSSSSGSDSDMLPLKQSKSAVSVFSSAIVNLCDFYLPSCCYHSSSAAEAAAARATEIKSATTTSCLFSSIVSLN